MFPDALTGVPFIAITLCALVFGAAGGAAGIFLTVKNEPFFINIVSSAAFLGILATLAVASQENYPVYFIFMTLFSIIGMGLPKLIRHYGAASIKTAEVITLVCILSAALTLFTYLREKSGEAEYTERLFFGNTVGLLSSEIILICLVSMAFIVFIYFCSNKLQISFFDGDYAESIGFSQKKYEIIFKLACMPLVFFGIQLTGIFLAGAIFLIPAQISRLFRLDFKKNLAVSSLTGALGTAAGADISANIPGASSGALIVLILAILFAAARIFLGNKRKEKGGQA